MADKLLVNLWGASISADGVWAIAAAVVIVLVIAWQKSYRSGEGRLARCDGG